MCQGGGPTKREGVLGSSKTQHTKKKKKNSEVWKGGGRNRMEKQLKSIKNTLQEGKKGFGMGFEIHGVCFKNLVRGRGLL